MSEEKQDDRSEIEKEEDKSEKKDEVDVAGEEKNRADLGESGISEAESKAKVGDSGTRAAEKQSEPAAADTAPAADPEREAKLKAAAEARAARAAAKAKAEAEAAQPKEPSPKQGELDRIAELLRSEVSPDAVLEAVLNELNGDMPMLVLEPAHWPAAAELLKRHRELRFNYLRNVSGIDYETHLEVVYHLLSMASHREVAVKLKADREQPSLPSAAPVWATANWNEREIYDLLGVKFEGHPDLRRIMMPDDWEGHPLRKDYEPLDSEV
ncbi:NADH-quinone oxidoreductase subunit C [Paenibacillus sp. HB172176]|uniref:NADH-quinone oxidoreductase subunit C n=1 Tax=Paenibacillus sp. HB172176 TaxID=2493690 RepID=UPI00143C986D|nr:NADH-quinone oxidoreductase subunit C [Paenibacillus sp. HB172176]